MANIKLVFLAIAAIVAVSNAASNAKVNAPSLRSARETVLPNTKTQPHIAVVYIKGCTECIATIIAPRWVIVSAGCASKIQMKEDVKILAGVSDLNGSHKGGQIRGIVNLFIKDRTAPDSCNPNNVALLLLDYPFDFSKPNVQKIDLPELYPGAVIENSYNVPYWEYRVCPTDYPRPHPLVVLYAKRVEPSLCVPKGHGQCYEPVVCIESIGDDMGPLMGPLDKVDECSKKPVLDAISMDLDLVLSDGYTPDTYHDAQAPMTYEILEWIHTTMNPQPEPIG